MSWRADLTGTMTGHEARTVLAMIAGDTAGAITLLPEGERPEPVGGDVE